LRCLFTTFNPRHTSPVMIYNRLGEYELEDNLCESIFLPD
jgi:hypothetical protein